MTGSKVKAAKKNTGTPLMPAELARLRQLLRQHLGVDRAPLAPGAMHIGDQLNSIACAIERLTDVLRSFSQRDEVDELRGSVANELAEIRRELEAWGTAAAAGDTQLRERADRLTDLLHANLHRLSARVSRLEVRAFGAISCICQAPASEADGTCRMCGRAIPWSEQRQAAEQET